MQGKQTYLQLSIKYNCSVKTIQRRIDIVKANRETTFPSIVNLLMDTTYFGRQLAVMIFICIPSTNPIFLHYKKCPSFAVMDAKNITQFAIMQTHIAACKASGITVEAYCRNHQLKPSVYYYWRKKLQPEEPGKFISITPLLSTAPVRITFTNGKRISFETMPPIDYVKQLMA